MRYDHESMLPIRAFQKVGGRMTLEGGGKGSSPPPPDYSSIAASNEAAARVSAEVAREQLAFQKDVYNQSRPQQERLEQLAAEVAQQQMDIADANQTQAEKQWNYYEGTFQPVEKKMVDEAMNYDSKARQEQMAGQATADVRSQMANATAQQNRALTGMGVNPNSGRFAGLSRAQAVQAGASQAGAATGARNSVVDKGIGLRAGAASFGRNMTNTAAQAYGLATNAGSSAVGNQNTGFMAGAAYPGLLNSGYSNVIGAQGQAINANLGIGQLMNQGYGIQSNAAAQQAAGQGAMTGQLVGTAAMVGVAAL
jgi:hypothetical protein